MNEENPIPENEGLVLNDKVKSDLIQMARLAKIMVALFYVGIVISLIKLAFLWSFYFGYNTETEVMPMMKSVALNNMLYGGLKILLLAAFMVYPAIKFVQFAGGMKKACRTNSADDAAKGFKRLRSFFRYNCIGILFFLPACFLALFIFADLLTRLLS